LAIGQTSIIHRVKLKTYIYQIDKYYHNISKVLVHFYKVLVKVLYTFLVFIYLFFCFIVSCPFFLCVFFHWAVTVGIEMAKSRGHANYYWFVKHTKNISNLRTSNQITPWTGVKKQGGPRRGQRDKKYYEKNVFIWLGMSTNRQPNEYGMLCMSGRFPK